VASAAEITIEQPSTDTLLLALSGSWKLGEALPSAADIQRRLEEAGDVACIAFDTQQLLVGWDSGLLTFLQRLRRLCEDKRIRIESSGLPAGARQLMALAAAVPEKKDARRQDEQRSFLAQVGEETVAFFSSAGRLLAFIGDATLAFARLLRGRAFFRRSDLFLIIESCGGGALPIVSLISFLVGLILAFVGAIQLLLFGAQIYVADLVGIAMVRLMAAVMTGVVMAGRTGGAFAAQLGTMQVNQEIDALKTLGLAPMEFLVLPRMLALALMMPLLCLYANVMGILGGLVVGVGVLDISLVQYYQRTVAAVRLWDLGIGIFSGIVFGVIIALAGCMRGMECGRSASAVGDAATSAVVTAIVGMTISTAVITVICNLLGI
jgi:phospholipid/cholesterol/gamma-HCH transport system permease protein